MAFLAALHALVLKLFYRYGFDSCLEIEAKSVGLAIQGPGLADCSSARSIEARRQAWAAQLPKAPEDLWAALAAFDSDSRQALFAHCVGLTVNAVAEPYNRRPRAIVHADRLASALDLDLAGAGWSPTVENFLGRVTKGRIQAAVHEACGEPQAQLIGHLRKADLAQKAQELLTGSAWLPEPLRTPGVATPHDHGAEAAPADGPAAAAIAAE